MRKHLLPSLLGVLTLLSGTLLGFAPAANAATAPAWQLPFQAGQVWRANGPHPDNTNSSARSSIDFGPTSSNRKVVAIAAGTVYLTKCRDGSSYIGVDHHDGYKSTYFHLVNVQTQLVGKNVPAGTYLGDAGVSTACGGTIYGRDATQVHLTIRNEHGTPVNINGFRFGNYRVFNGAHAYAGRWVSTVTDRTVFSASAGMTGALKSTTPIPSAPKAPLPTKPGDPHVTASTPSSLTVQWVDKSSNETSFVSQYKTGVGGWITGPSAGRNATSLTIPGLKPNTDYMIEIGARNAAGPNWSNSTTGHTGTVPAAPPAAPPVSAPPAAPAGSYHTGRQVTIPNQATGGVSGHTGPGNSYPAGPTRARGSSVWIVCYVNGQAITGPWNNRETTWDLATDGHYYADAWMYTGSNSAVVPRCALRQVTVPAQAAGGVSGHTGPGNSYAAGPTRPRNSQVTVACYINGQAITGPWNNRESVWDLGADGYFYADAWMYTGSNNPVVPHC